MPLVAITVKDVIVGSSSRTPTSVQPLPGEACAITFNPSGTSAVQVLMRAESVLMLSKFSSMFCPTDTEIV